MAPLSTKKIAIVADALIGPKESNRMVELIAEMFPHADVYAPCFQKDKMEMAGFAITNNIISAHRVKLSDWRNINALESLDFSGYDIVISISSAFAHGVVTSINTLHIAYIYGIPEIWSGKRKGNPLHMANLRLWDIAAAARPNLLVANSSYTKLNILKHYRRESEVLYPFIDLAQYTIPAHNGGYVLSVGKLVPQRGLEELIYACNDLGMTLRIVGNGEKKYEELLHNMASANISFFHLQSDQAVKEHYAGCDALIITHPDDFPFIALEAQAFGKPIIGYRRGGLSDIIEENMTGVFFDEIRFEAIKQALQLSRDNLTAENCLKRVQRFKKESCKKKIGQYITNAYENRHRL